jgi:hypothetical protein
VLRDFLFVRSDRARALMIASDVDDLSYPDFVLQCLRNRNLLRKGKRKKTGLSVLSAIL